MRLKQFKINNLFSWIYHLLKVIKVNEHLLQY